MKKLFKITPLIINKQNYEHIIPIQYFHPIQFPQFPTIDLSI